MNIHVFTLFPEAFPGTLGLSICGRAMEEKKWNLNIVNLRDYGIGPHQNVDEYPFGGGAGMLMRPDVIYSAVKSVKAENPLILLMSASGYQYNQKIATKLSHINRDIFIICGRFEGVDARVIEALNMIEISLGQYVIFGGECAAMVVIESIVRLLDGVCGNEQTHAEESFSGDFENLMEYRQYTKPRQWMEIDVPPVLLSGNHKNIADFRLSDAKFQTSKYSNIDPDISN